ncbi:MAG: asparagine synthase (glutamine-hydrolyzing) [Bacteroidia bacterium]
MCGITGIWHLNGQVLPRQKLERITRSIAHRGPDGEGFYLDENTPLGLGHLRLSILDLSASGAQPMSYGNGRFQIVYNGEIFNFLELRNELRQLGHSFITESDTEVVLAAFAEWKAQCLLKFNGMWAFAIWDVQEQMLFLARDRFGIKPLYYLHRPGNIFAFASETNAFKNLENFNREIDLEMTVRAIRDAAALEGSGYTIYKNLRQLLPGHFIYYKKNDVQVRQKRWWNTLSHLPEVPQQYEEQCEAFRDLFADACRLRLRSDVPVASALSGGIDSTAVYSMIYHLKDQQGERKAQEWQKAFVATFPGTAQDEREFAEKVVQQTGGEAEYLETDFFDLQNTLVESTIQFDAIYGSPNFILNPVYATMGRNGYKVSMDGHGADELLFGYSAMIREALTLAATTGAEEWQVALEKVIKEMGPAPIFHAKKNTQAEVFNKLFKSILKRLKNGLNGKPTRGWRNGFELKPLPALTDSEVNIQTLDEYNRITWKYFHQNPLPAILRNFDKAAMRYGVEVRMPFMDWRLVCFCFALPMESKLRGGFTKAVLRDALQGIMPDEIRTRKLKTGLIAPMNDWFSGPLASFIMDTVSSRSFIQSDLWNGPVIRDFAKNKIITKSWTMDDGHRFWPYLNAHILMTGN